MIDVKKPPEIDGPDEARPTAPVASPGASPGGASRPGHRAAALGPGAVVVAGALFLFLTGLGGIDLWAPDEPRYAAIAETLRSGEYGLPGLVLLHLNGEPYTQKPPLYFGLAALFGLAGGRVDEVAARLPSALAGVACVALTYWIARRLGERKSVAALAAAILATSFRFAFTARRAQLDVLLCAFELAAVALYVLLETRRGGIASARRSPALIAALHGALGCAALVKGPVGWLPLAIFAAHLASTGRRRAFRQLVPAWSWLLSLGPLAVWIASASALAPAGFWREAVATNVFARFFAGSSHARPFYYYAYQLPLDFLPWTLLWPAAMPALRRAWGASSTRLLGAWVAVPLVFFSLSAGKRGLYLLPIFPALALLCASAVVSAKGNAGARVAADPQAEASGATRRRRWLGAAIALVAVVELAGALVGLPRLDAEKSPRPIARALAARARPDERVGLFGLRPLEGALPYYGSGPVVGLRDEDALRRFLEAPERENRLVLLPVHDFDRLAPALGLEALERWRSGRRALVLAHPAVPTTKDADPRRPE